jgi:hypothetical protein
VFAEPGGLEIIDGFERVRAARAPGWAMLVARIDDGGASTRSCASASCTTGAG